MVIGGKFLDCCYRVFCLKCSRAFHPFSPNIRLGKDRFSWQCFQNISQTQIRDYDGVRYLVLFGPKKYHVIYDKIRCLLSHKVVLNILFCIIMQKSKLILMIL